jgi:hypothetical protein
MQRQAFLAAIAAVWASGCTDSPLSVESGRVSASVANAEGVEQSATGSGQFVINGQQRTFAFTAIKHADGRVTGMSQLVRRFPVGPDARFHVEVTCLRVVGNHAWIGGIVRSTSLADFDGTEAAFQVEDNGEGRNDPPDLISFEGVGGLPGYAEEYCNTMAPDDLFPITGGNIQVRP